MQRTMATLQQATLPPWLQESRWALFRAVVGTPADNWRKLVHVAAVLAAYVRPAITRRRLERLKALGHIDAIPTLAQLLVGARDQMILAAAEETRVFYESQGIPWGFHNFRRFISGPATMMDPMGLFSPRDVIIEHVLQTFHRHPLYDVILLRAYEGGEDELERQAEQIAQGIHPRQRALASLIEDGSYHSRLVDDIQSIRANPHMSARPIPEGLVDDPYLMLGMDQFKDIRGYTRYAARLDVTLLDAIRAWAAVGFNESLGGLVGVKLGPRQVSLPHCDPDLVDVYFAAGDAAGESGGPASQRVA